MKAVLRIVVTASLLASPAFAQTSAGAWNGLPDRFQIDTGYFRISASTVLRYNGPQGSGDIDFEKDLGLDQKANTFWLDATWRLGRRHQLKLGFTRLVRDRADYTLQRDITWGGQTYDAGLTASSSTGSDILGGYYRFAAFRNERFEIGPTIGIGYLSVSARIQATGTIGGAVSRSLDQKAETGSVTGALGGYASAWPTKRLALRGDFLYIKVTPGNSEASVTDWRLGADYYFLRNAGVGVQYKYDRYSYDHGILVSKLGGEITYKGVQVFVSFLF
jgi:hypothetical protein